MALPNIQNWFTPQTTDDWAPEWQVGKIYYDGQEFTPDELDAFAAELVTLAATARQNAGRGGTRVSDQPEDPAETAHKIIETWNRGLITLAEMVTELQKVSAVRDRELLQAGAEIAARRNGSQSDESLADKYRAIWDLRVAVTDYTDAEFTTLLTRTGVPDAAKDVEAARHFIYRNPS